MSREAIVVALVARFRWQAANQKLDFWSALAAYANRPVVTLATAAAVISSIVSFAATTRPAPQPPLIPSPIARWVASSSTPSPVEIMDALSELRQ